MVKRCLYCGKILEKKRAKFCSSSHAASYNNARRPPQSAEQRRKISASLKEYHTMHSISKSTRARLKQSHSKVSKRRLSLKSIYEVSSRTRQKMLTRMGINKCVVCGWDEATCDVHHIAGRMCHDHKNLMLLCPNHHRVAREARFDLSIYPTIADILPENWRDFYFG